MVTNNHIGKRRAGTGHPTPSSLAVSFGTLVAAAFFAAVLFSSPALAQQRVVIERATGNIADVGDRTLQYDSRYFDHVDFPVSPIPPGENIRKYMRDTSGAIVLRPKDELVKGFDDEWKSDLMTRINGSGLSADLKALLLEIVKSMRR
jgi:hypothetical protein